MAWSIEYTPNSIGDLESLDNSQRIQVLKTIRKITRNPLPNTEGGYGKPLGNRGTSNLVGYLKIKLKKLGIRVVYRIVYDKKVMRIVIISLRADNQVYMLLQERILKGDI